MVPRVRVEDGEVGEGADGLMPAESKVQQEMMGADLARLRAGKPTRTHMSETQLEEFAGTPRKGLPERKHTLKAAIASRSHVQARS